MKNEIRLGALIEGDELRDAVHIAVAPVVAYRGVMPGTAIGFVDDSDTEVDALSENLIGIVDPFLTKMVKRGERFWMFLFPNSITSLRHEWTHPAFEIGPQVAPKTKAETRLIAFAENSGLSYQALLDGAKDYLENNEYLSQGGRWEGHSLYDEFWDDYEIMTGTKVGDNERGSFFSCSC